MKTLMASLVIFAVAVTANADVIAVEDFDGGLPSWTNDIAAQVFVDPSSSNQGLFVGDNSGGFGGGNIGSGNTAFARDLGGESGEPTLSPYTFTFNAVDTSLFSNIVLTFEYYAFANADSGSYEVFINGVGQGANEWYNDPDTTAVSGMITENIGTAAAVGLVLTGTLNAENDVFELDNFALNGDLAPVPEPNSLALIRDRGNWFRFASPPSPPSHRGGLDQLPCSNRKRNKPAAWAWRDCFVCDSCDLTPTP